jgi:outer membrane receptor protein involved in Fe transport
MLRLRRQLSFARWLAAAILLGLLLRITPAAAQSTELRLQVQDPSGAGMQATGKLQLESAQPITFQTDAQGLFQKSGLPPGRYRVEISKSGFATSVTQLTLDATPVSQTITLALSSSAFAVDVVATTPLPGSDQSRNEIASPIQTATQLDIQASGSLELSDFINRRLSGVHLNEMQGNPYQADLNYRGYTASPLLGTPQGVSVYMDGVRLNQPFGDVVSWDLIPRQVIAETSLIPGSNPLFGLNTLGGAISIRTKDGHTNPGTLVEASGGSYGRRAFSAEHGGSTSRGLNWFLAGNLFHDDGWRDNSPSDVRQVFGKLAWEKSRTALSITTAYADNTLNGNGLQEQRFLARDYASVYTKPDITNNRSPFLNISLRHTLSSTLSFTGNAYYRFIQTASTNGDLNEGSLDQSVYQPSAADRSALTAAGYTGFPTSGANAANTPFPYWRCIAQALQRDEPGEKCNGLITHGSVRQHNYGFSGQLTSLRRVVSQANQFTAGFAFDRSNLHFEQLAQLGYLNPDRSVTGVNAFADGVTGGNVDGAPLDTRVNLSGAVRTFSFYATDTLRLGSHWNLTLSGRYNRTMIDNQDRLRPIAGPGSLTGNHSFDRLNPAVGLTYNPARAWNAYFGYSEGSRAPTSIELGCADPQQPCKLPNAMAGDPPLKQVVARTFEAGLRGGNEGSVHWSFGLFRAVNRDDILFVASQQTGFGYFRNFGKTQRQGLEVDLNTNLPRLAIGHVALGSLTIGGSYTLLDATYQSSELVQGSSNSANDSDTSAVKGLDGSIAIASGNQIPLIPRHLLKSYLDWQLTKRLSLDAGLIAISSSYARGNENNQHQPDGVYYLGPGRSPGYAVMNLGARFDLTKRLQAFAQVNNLLDRHYYSAAQLGPVGFSSNGNFIARPFAAAPDGSFPVQHSTFYAPGSPRTALGGLRFRF